jgi:8-oxo-dGTP pyrophosphatase MutT (NUDIX family)
MQAADHTVEIGNGHYVERLRARLKHTRLPEDPMAARHQNAYQHLPAEAGFDSREARLAAVLVPLVRRERVPGVLLTRRTEHLLDHAGQVSFPGGSAEPDDADAVATALRETNEELGIPGARIETIGFLDPYHTTTGFVIVPVVGVVEPGPLRPNPDEVAAAFEVPLDYLLRESVFKRREKQFGSRTVAWFVVEYEGETIWGATAEMLHKL